MTTIDSVYTQRNELAVAFAKAALAAGWKAGRGIDSKADPEWANVVYVDLPDGRQVSWHISPDCVPLLDGLPQYAGTWDGTFIGRETGWSRGIEVVAQQKDPTDPGHDVDVLREHVRHLERRIRELHAQQAEPDHETRAELAEQQVVQLAEERDHYRNLWQKAQQANHPTIERLRDALVASRIIDPAAVEDPDEYDDGATLHRIEALHWRLT